MLRVAVQADQAQVLALFRAGVAHMLSSGIRHWDQGYPTAEILAGDILLGQMYVLEQSGTIAAAMVLNQDQDPQYLLSQWTHMGPFGCIHRLCVHPDAQRQGVGKRAVLAAEEFFRQRGCFSIRLDTFSGNPAAMGLYSSLGYQPVGQAFFRDRGPFIVFEKVL